MVFYRSYLWTPLKPLEWGETSLDEYSSEFPHFSLLDEEECILLYPHHSNLWARQAGSTEQSQTWSSRPSEEEYFLCCLCISHSHPFPWSNRVRQASPLRQPRASHLCHSYFKRLYHSQLLARSTKLVKLVFYIDQGHVSSEARKVKSGEAIIVRFWVHPFFHLIISNALSGILQDWGRHIFKALESSLMQGCVAFVVHQIYYGDSQVIIDEEFQGKSVSLLD